VSDPKSKKIVISNLDDKTLTVALVDGEIDMISVRRDNFKVGNIYVGKVTEVVKNIKACFVNITPDTKCFLAQDDCPDKQLPVSGTELVVRVKKDGNDIKLPACTTKLLKNEEEILNKAKTRTIYTCLYKAKKDYIKFLNSVPFEEISDIITDRQDVLDDIRESLPEYVPLLRMYSDERLSLINLFSLREKTERLLKKKVWLDNGAYLVIEHTEAFDVIDVNSGKYDKKTDSKESLLGINSRAAIEAARQIRLRNLSGIILIDFINMEKEETEVISGLLKEEFKKDSLKPKVIDFTPLCICEITRPKKNRSLWEMFYEKVSD